MAIKSSEFKNWLKGIANNLDVEDTKNITYMCNDGIEENEWDRIKTGKDLINKFNSTFLFSSTDELEMLAEIFRIIGKSDLEVGVKKFLAPKSSPVRLLVTPGDLLTPDHFQKTLVERKVPTEISDDDWVNEGNNVVNGDDNSEGASSNTQSKAGLYDMKKKPRGVCIIINNTFEEREGQSPVQTPRGEILTQRKGTNYDRDRLKTLFEWLNFQVVVKSDLTAEGMRNVFREVANASLDSDENSEIQNALLDSDCFVFSILSHGYKGGLYGADGHRLATSNIMEYLGGNRCKHLRKKPKLGFIQACRGNKDIAVVQRDSPMSVAKSPTEDMEPPDIFQNQAAETESVTPTAALTDILIYDATARGYASYRDPHKGSFFIQNLCEVFEQHATDTPLSQMRFLIQQTLSVKVAQLRGGVRAGMVADSGCDTLEHDIYFNPDTQFNDYLDSRGRKVPVEN